MVPSVTKKLKDGLKPLKISVCVSAYSNKNQNIYLMKNFIIETGKPYVIHSNNVLTFCQLMLSKRKCTIRILYI